MMRTILLDMDGVCVGFVRGALRACDNLVLEPKDITCWEMEGFLGMSTAEMWRHIDAKGEAFWANLKDQPWFDDLYDALAEQGNVWFCTTPPFAPWAMSGKLHWLQDRFGHGFRNYIFITDKTLLAKPGHVLIDDNADTVRKFREAGGEAVLFPMPWNDAPRDSFCAPWRLP